MASKVHNRQEELSIQDFGPIRKADITVRDLTVFVGPQATGKSLAAQLLYFFSGLEDLLSQPQEPFLGQNDDAASDKAQLKRQSGLLQIMSALEWWLGNPTSIYARADTALSWFSGQPPGKSHNEIQWSEKQASINRALEKRAKAWLLDQASRTRESHIYVPAGRTVYSFLPPSTALRLVSRRSSKMEWPGYIFTFYSALGEAITDLWRDQERGYEQQPNLFELEHLSFLQSRIDSIMKGTLRFGPETIQLKTGGKSLRPATIAAGQMDIWPFWVVVREQLRTGRAETTRIYFEEPEAHLHPEAQRKTMEIIAYLVQLGMRFVITTHSPYVLYALNNFLESAKVLSEKQELPRDLIRDVALRPDKVAAYRFSSDGHVSDIMDQELGLIDEDELDKVADELGSMFARLQDKLEAQ